MATLVELCDAGELIQINVALDDELPQRCVYAVPSVVKWLTDELNGLHSFHPDGDLDPQEQLDLLLYDFIRGDDFSYYKRCHSMKPVEPGVWELKTLDLRLFGWFYKRAVFVIAEIDTMERVKTHQLYTGYLGSVVRCRDRLDLDEPKFVTGEYSDVL